MPRTSLPLAARIAIGLALLAGAGAVAWVISGDTLSAPVKVVLEPEDPGTAEQLANLRTTSLEHEAAFDAAVPGEAVATPEQITLLEQAWQAQKNFVGAQLSPAWADRDRERRLEVRVATARGRAWSANSEQLERQATALLAAGDRHGGLAALREALRLQREVNLSPADPEVRRTLREAELAERVDTLEAEPLAAEVERLEQAGQAAVAAGDHATAAQAYEQAADCQRRLNQLFSRTRFSSTVRLDRLQTELASLGARELAVERDRRLAEAQQQEAAGAAAAAAAAYVQARDLQARINREFAHSREASAPRLEEIEVARQTASSRPRFAVFTALEEKVTTALRARRVEEARGLIEQLVAEAQGLAQDAPRSALLAPGWRTRIDYLDAIAPVLPLVQADILDHLAALPGSRGRMLTGEISQGCYSAVMGGNPARVPGQRLPVESLTAEEALEFCRRLAWVLGQDVRLPSRAEFATALSAGDEEGWTAENSDGMPRAVDAGPVNRAGFRNLRGNVAEWVTGAGAGQMLIAGGSYAEPELTAAEGPFRLVPQTERFRTVGFRVVVE